MSTTTTTTTTTMNMMYLPTNHRPANDNGRPTRIVSLGARRAGQARRRKMLRDWGPAILATFFTLGCGPTFDPASLVNSTRVVGAHVEAAGPDDRATAAPGESAKVTWLVTAPAAVPDLQWAFALCAPAPAGALGCASAPLAVFQGTGNPPTAPVTMPAADALAGVDHLTLFGRICDTGAPIFDPQGNPGCADGAGTTASVELRVQTADLVNHNPVADHGLTFDGQPWPALAAGADPCATGPTVTAGTEDHEVSLTTLGADRESYTVSFGDPPVPTPKREALQVSFFTTAGKLKSPFVFVEAADPNPETPASLHWNAPKIEDVTAPTPVTFTFVVRDGRGGTDWTSRAACVTPG
jgi:hypothetical protein